MEVRPARTDVRVGETVAERRARRLTSRKQCFRIFIDEKKNLLAREEVRKVCARDTGTYTGTESGKYYTRTRLEWMSRDAMKICGVQSTTAKLKIRGRVRTTVTLSRNEVGSRTAGEQRTNNGGEDMEVMTYGTGLGEDRGNMTGPVA